MPEKRPRSGNQMNMYLSDERAAEIDAVGVALAKKDKVPRSRQQVLLYAFDQWKALLNTLNGKKE